MVERHLEQRIRQLGFRVTPQRQSILEAVAEAGEKVTIDEILDRVRAKSTAISQATVYRTLEVFGEHGLVHTNVLHGQRVYEIAAENVHHHIICQNCWRDQRIPHEVVEEFVQMVEDRYGFQPRPRHLFLLGLCEHCLEEEKKRAQKQ